VDGKDTVQHQPRLPAPAAEPTPTHFGPPAPVTIGPACRPVLAFGGRPPSPVGRAWTSGGASVVTSAAGTVVRGTAAISPTDPHRARTTSTATISVVAMVPSES
jgi:hypothetical protein